jgi:antitoxin (DNA-binding transcriptional repressor) of toxin-antitoxin stability system
MATVSIRDLRNKGGEVVDRAARGEVITITKSGKPVAELRALPRKGLSREELLARRRRLPSIDPVELRTELDSIIDPRL